MFLPLVTNRRSPITLAPVVRPMSSLSEPRYSTLSEETQSGPCLSAAANGAVAREAASAAAIANVNRTYPTAPARYRSGRAGAPVGYSDPWTRGLVISARVGVRVA